MLSLHIEINVIAVAIHLLLHDRAGTLASLLYKAEKPSLRPSVCLSVCPQFFGQVDLRPWCTYRRQTCSKRNAHPLG